MNELKTNQPHRCWLELVYNFIRSPIHLTILLDGSSFLDYQFKGYKVLKLAVYMYLSLEPLHSRNYKPVSLRERII